MERSFLKVDLTDAHRGSALRCLPFHRSQLRDFHGGDSPLPLSTESSFVCSDDSGKLPFEKDLDSLLVARLIELQGEAARHTEPSDPAEPVVLDLLGELDTLTAQVLDSGLDIVTVEGDVVGA